MTTITHSSATYDNTTPGGIKVTKATLYAYWAEKGVDLDAKITAHITAWAASVPVGTMVTVHQMLMAPGCVCPFEFGWHLLKCKGMPTHDMPMEIVMDHLFPPDGSPCAVPGVMGLATQGPLIESGLGLVKYALKTA